VRAGHRGKDNIKIDLTEVVYEGVHSIQLAKDVIQ
jgi:hypothetical protein